MLAIVTNTAYLCFSRQENEDFIVVHLVIHIEEKSRKENFRE